MRGRWAPPPRDGLKRQERRHESSEMPAGRCSPKGTAKRIDGASRDEHAAELALHFLDGILEAPVETLARAHGRLATVGTRARQSRSRSSGRQERHEMPDGVRVELRVRVREHRRSAVDRQPSCSAARFYRALRHVDYAKARVGHSSRDGSRLVRRAIGSEQEIDPVRREPQRAQILNATFEDGRLSLYVGRSNVTRSGRSDGWAFGERWRAGRTRDAATSSDG